MRNTEVYFSHQVREFFHSLEPILDDRIISEIRSYIILNKATLLAKSSSKAWNFWTRLHTVRVNMEVKRSRHQKVEEQILSVRILEVLPITDT